VLTENNNLFAYARNMSPLRPPPENHISTKQPSEERIIRPLLSWLRAHILQQQHRRLVYRCIFCQILGMCSRRAEDEFQFLLHGARPEHKYHTTSPTHQHCLLGCGLGGECGLHQRMWESDFGAVDSAIPRSFQDSKEIRIFRVQNNTLERSLSD
jgi:hypothetical protein